MYVHSQRLDERPELGIDAFRQLVQIVRRYRHVLAQAARHIDAVRFPAAAEMIVAASALRARAAYGEQLERNALALGEAMHTFAERFDLAGYFVPETEPRRK